MRWTTLAAVCSLFAISAGSPSHAEETNVNFVAMMESTSFVDTGIKAVVFGDGHGWLLRSKGEESPAIKRINVSPAEMKVISATVNRNYFFELPTRIETHATDGTEIDLYITANGRCKLISSYMSFNSAFNNIEKTVHEILEKKGIQAQTATAEDFAKDCKHTVAEFKKGSPNSECAAKFFDALYFDYAANSSTDSKLKTQLASLLSEPLEALNAKRLAHSNKDYAEREALRKSGPNPVGTVDAAKVLAIGAKKIVEGTALKGHDSSSESDRQTLSQWWTDIRALDNKVNNAEWLTDLHNKVTPESLKVYTAHQFLQSAHAWLERSVVYSMRGDKAKALLCLKGANVLIDAAGNALSGKLEPSLRLTNGQTGTCLADCTDLNQYVEKNGKIVAVPVPKDPNQRSFGFIRGQDYLPTDDPR